MARPAQQPTLQTDRLRLRPFSLADAPMVQALAGAVEVASTTLVIPHPYEKGMAESWISIHEPGYKAGEQATFAIVLKESGELVGAIGLSINVAHRRAEMGYWVGVPFWNRGYATEAAVAMLAFGLDVLELHRIHAMHLARNPASGRVMQKAGMRHEGRQRQHIQKWGIFEDVELYGVLADDRIGPDPV